MRISRQSQTTYTIIAGCFWLLSCGGGTNNNPPEIILSNEGKYPLREIYVWNRDAPSPGPNRIASEIPPGSEINVPIYQDSEGCHVRYEAVYTNGDRYGPYSHNACWRNAKGHSNTADVRDVKSEAAENERIRRAEEEWEEEFESRQAQLRGMAAAAGLVLPPSIAQPLSRFQPTTPTQQTAPGPVAQQRGAASYAQQSTDQCSLGPQCQRLSDRGISIINRLASRTEQSVLGASNSAYCVFKVSAEVNRVCADEFANAGRQSCADASNLQKQQFEAGAAQAQQGASMSSAVPWTHKCGWN